MTERYLIEPGIGLLRTALIDGDDIPLEVGFIGSPSLDPTDSVMTARVTRVDTASDMAFLTLPTGGSGAIGYRRAQALANKPRDSLKGISDCVSEGQLVKVQALGEASALEDKAVPLTAKPKLVGRYLVVEAARGRLNFSKDIKPHAIGPLKTGLAAMAEQVSIIVRAAAGLVSTEAVLNEAAWLMTAFKDAGREPEILFAPSPLERALLAAPDGDAMILIEGTQERNKAKALATKRWPDLLSRIKGWSDEKPMMEEMGVEDAIEEALAERITLPSGGWIAVRETPALTTVDVNMGGALQGRTAADARRLTNLEAALATAFHLRFQNMGGLIVVDFIDNNAKGAVAEMIRYIDAALKDDIVPVAHTGLSAFGLMQFNRRRRGRSLRERLMHHPKPQEKTSNMALSLLRLAKRVGAQPKPGDIVIAGPDSVIKWLESQDNLIAELQAATTRSVRLQVAKTNNCSIEKE